MTDAGGKMKKYRTSAPTLKDLRLALLKISEMGRNVKLESIDWISIGKNAVAVAKEVLREKCKECGK